MKKIIKIILSIILSCSLFSTPLLAKDTQIIPTSKICQISKRGNNVYEENSYIVSKSQLVGTKHENKQIIVKKSGVYINGKRATNQIRVNVKDILVGWIIDGILYYATGYSDAQLAASVITEIAAFCMTHPAGAIVVAVVLFTVTSSSIQNYTTSTGNVCVKTRNSYACKYGIETDKPVVD